MTHPVDATMRIGYPITTAAPNAIFDMRSAADMISLHRIAKE